MPDFVLEIASPSTRREDIGIKRDFYAALGIPEYWRFDETGEFHGSRLAGDRLVDGQYEPLPVEPLEDGIFQGFSSVLSLFIRWEQGQLAWHDPKTGRHIATLEDERERVALERARAEQEQAARVAAETRVRELESELAGRNSKE